MEAKKPKAKKTIVEKSGFEKVMELFNEEVNDKELQGNYDGFKRSRECAKERHNGMVPEINALIQKGEGLKELIVDLSCKQLSTVEAVEAMLSLPEPINELREKINYQKGIMDEQDRLMKFYTDSTERKLFHFWKVFKALDEETLPWMEWKRAYTDIIF